MEHKWLIAGTVAALVLVGAGATAYAYTSGYPISRKYPYGPKWGLNKPPTLPDSARLCSPAGGAHTPIAKVAVSRALEAGKKDGVDYDPALFARVMAVLADNESGGTYARPADAFDLDVRFRLNDKGETVESQPVTAWGTFQWNEPAWASLKETREFMLAIEGAGAVRHAWDATPLQELDFPIQRYLQIYTHILRNKGAAHHAAYGVFLYHAGSGSFRRFLQISRKYDFETAMTRLLEGLTDPGERGSIFDCHSYALRLLGRVFPKTVYEIESLPTDKKEA